MSKKMWTRWTHEAIKRDDRTPDLAPEDPRHTLLYEWTSRPNNWFPDNVMDRLRTADDPQAEYVDVVIETLIGPGSADEWSDAPDERPVWFGTFDHVAGEMYDLASRLVKGTIHEVAAAEHLEADGRTVLDTAEAVEAAGFDDTTAMEEAGIDLVTADDSTFQVKSSEPSEEVLADFLIIVTDGEVNEVRDVR
jgi:hypothetical protein